MSPEEVIWVSKPMSEIRHIVLCSVRLLSELREAASRLPDARDGGRDAALYAVASVAEFVHSLPENHENLTLLLGFLMDAISDLDEGNQALMLTPASVNGRRKEPRIRKRVKGVSAFVIDLLKENGMSVDDAAKLITKELKEVKFPIGGKIETPSWRTVKGWRDDLSHYEMEDTAQRARADFGNIGENITFPALRDCRVFCLARLRYFLRTVRPLFLE